MAQTRQMTPDALSLLAQPGTPIAAKLAVAFAVKVTLWATRRRTRLVLSRLEPWQLTDVGLTPGQAEIEASRVFWRA